MATKFDPTVMQPPDKHGIVAHTPDPTRYFSPDDNLTRRMRSGIRATMIPRATRHGGSQGFTPGAGYVSVDPEKLETGEGGIQVDLSLISPETSEMAYERACELTNDPEERIIRAYQLMGLAVESANEMQTYEANWDDDYEEERTNPVMPGAYVVPKSTVSGKQIKPKPKKRKKPKAVVPKAVRKPKPTVSVESKKRTRNNDPVLDLLVAMKHELDELKAEKRGAVLPKTAPPPIPKRPSIPNYGEEPYATQEPQIQQKQPAPEIKSNVYTQDQVIEALRVGYSKLGIPNLAPDAKKPTFRVEFDLGPAGKQEAWYHWVGEHNDCLFLIYDQRFEYGLRYSPPFLGFDNPIKVRLPDHNKEYRVISLDLTHPFGVFYITNLILDREPIPQTGSADHALNPIAQKLIQESFEDEEDWYGAQ